MFHDIQIDFTNSDFHHEERNIVLGAMLGVVHGIHKFDVHTIPDLVNKLVTFFIQADVTRSEPELSKRMTQIFTFACEQLIANKFLTSNLNLTELGHDLRQHSKSPWNVSDIREYTKEGMVVQFLILFAVQETGSLNYKIIIDCIQNHIAIPQYLIDAIPSMIQLMHSKQMINDDGITEFGQQIMNLLSLEPGNSHHTVH